MYSVADKKKTTEDENRHLPDMNSKHESSRFEPSLLRAETMGKNHRQKRKNMKKSPEKIHSHRKSLETNSANDCMLSKIYNGKEHYIILGEVDDVVVLDL